MTFSVEEPLPPMLADFLGFTLSGNRPRDESAAGECGAGLHYAWLGDGVIEFDLAPPALENSTARAGELGSVMLSAGVHGDETAPIELLSRIVADIASGALPLACRLLVTLGNIDAMRAGCRYLDDDLNRLFCGRHAALPTSREAPRAAALEAAASRFFGRAAAGGPARWHLDMHTAIRASVFEQFALLPYTGGAPSREMLGWVASARIPAVLIHTAKSNTFAHFTAERFGATACTLELGKVRPFGQNDLSRFSAADEAVRELLRGVREPLPMRMPRVFTVVDQIVKRTDAFVLNMAPDVPNFTAFPKGTELARDDGYRYVVQHDEEYVVFPNPSVKPGLRAGLTLIETTRETLAAFTP